MVQPLFLNMKDHRIVWPLEKETGRTSGEPLLKMNVRPFCFVIGRTILRHVLDKKIKNKNFGPRGFEPRATRRHSRGLTAALGQEV